MDAWEQGRLALNGWYAHLIPEGADTPTGFDIHTHGLKENFGQTDFQIVTPGDPRLHQQLLRHIISLVKQGERFKAGDRISGVFLGRDVLLAEAQEMDRTVLRITTPDDPAPMVDLFDWLEQVGVNVPEEHRAEVAAEFAEIAREMGYKPPAGGST
jgi:hypothetical protein